MKKTSLKLEKIRHSLSHIMAHAVQDLFKDVKFGIGPTIEDGFYYDFDLPQSFKDEDLPKIEKGMKKLIAQNLEFKKTIETTVKAKKRSANQPYKLELIKELTKEKQPISYYTAGKFDDLCGGPHVKSTKEIPIDSFKLIRTAGAYWRGSENNPQLQRIYGIAFETKKELDKHLKLVEEAKKRDHRKLGRELELFMFHETAPGMPYWLPKGVILYNKLIEFWREEHQKHGYQEVFAPLINKQELYEISGHWKHYRENMFISKTEDKEVYGLKPMNCPNAMIVYGARRRSYRELPLRLGDTDTLHRYEPSGTLNGLFRVREFRQDDAHIFVAENQIKSEYEELFEITKRFYSVFNLEYSFRLGTRPEKFMGEKKTWDIAEKELKNILEKSGEKYFIEEGDGAFYGPKIDILMKDSIGREWQMGTLQLDFHIPKAFNLTYIDQNGKEKTPITIHRVIYGSLERFIGILIEHYAGAFPVWLSPTQIYIIPVGKAHFKFAKELGEQLTEEGLRVEVDLNRETVGYKIRKSEKIKVPYMLVIGDKEMKSRSLNVRIRGQKVVKKMTQKAFVDRIKKEIQEKKYPKQ